MRAEEYLPLAIERALSRINPERPVKAYPVRLPPDVDGVPSVIWRMITGYEPEGPFPYTGTLDGSASLQRFFEIECRAVTCPGAVAMADDVLAELSSVATGVFARYDEADDSFQKLAQSGQDDGDAGYFSHILEVGLPDEGLPTIGG